MGFGAPSGFFRRLYWIWVLGDDVSLFHLCFKGEAFLAFETVATVSVTGPLKQSDGEPTMANASFFVRKLRKLNRFVGLGMIHASKTQLSAAFLIHSKLSFRTNERNLLTKITPILVTCRREIPRRHYLALSE